MRKIMLIITISLCVLAFTTADATTDNTLFFDSTISESHEKEFIRGFTLPASVEIIEDEAFESTALVKVELPQSVIVIGERAFADISTLREVIIPQTTSYIASTAFEGSNRTTITAPGNSYAQTWAKEHGVPFSPIIMFCASTQLSTTSIMLIDGYREIIERNSSSDKKPGKQWYIIEEINITRAEELIANHVQGRSPPMS